jgi:hypothetical protein
VCERERRKLRRSVLKKRDEKKEKTLHDCVGRESKEEEIG